MLTPKSGVYRHFNRHFNRYFPGIHKDSEKERNTKMTEHSFTGADILLPKKDFEKWAVIA